MFLLCNRAHNYQLKNLIYHISKTYALCFNLLYFTYGWLYAETQSAFSP